MRIKSPCFLQTWILLCPSSKTPLPPRFWVTQGFFVLRLILALTAHICLPGEMGHQLQVQHIWMGEEVKRAANKHSKSTVSGMRNLIKNILQWSELPSLVISCLGCRS